MRRREIMFVACFVLSACVTQPWYQKYGIESEAELKTARGVHKLIYSLKKPRYADEAAVQLAKIGAPAVQPLSEALFLDDRRIRFHAARVLGVLAHKAKPAVGSLIAALNDKSPQVRERVAMTLGTIGDGSPKVLQALQAVFSTEQDLEVKAAAGRSIRRLKLAGLVSSSPSTASASSRLSATPMIVAVFDLEDTASKLSVETRQQLTAYLVTKLTETGTFRVVPRDQLRSQLATSKKDSHRDCFDQSCQIELGKALAAQKSLATRLTTTGGACTVLSDLYDLKSETTERGASVKSGCEESRLMVAIEQVAQQLSK
jgi:HEAT repeat protein